MQGLRDLILENIKQAPVKKDPGGIPAEPARLLFGRGGGAAGFENINIDFFPPLIYITIYSEFSDERLESLSSVLESIFPDSPMLIQDRSVRPAEIRIASGEVPEELIISEGRLSFLLHPLRGQNPGFFPDMRIGRQLITEIVSGEILKRRESEQSDVRVLNLFAYTCSLSVRALAAGASRVVNIDMNRQSLEIGRRNHLLNGFISSAESRKQALFLPHDVFKSFGRLRREGPYHLIIADPPPAQKGSFMMRSDYPRLIRRLPEMLRPGGRIMLTLNSPGWSLDDFERLIAESSGELKILKMVDPPADFAPSEEGRGLKIILAGLTAEL